MASGRTADWRHVRLVVMEGGNPVREYRLDRFRTSIGRSKLNQVVVESQGVSQFHAQITVEDGEFRLTDLGTQQGVVINGEKVKEKVLEIDDEIRIGGVSLKLAGEGRREAPAAGPRARRHPAREVSRRAIVGVVLLAAVLGLVLLLDVYLGWRLFGS